MFLSRAVWLSTLMLIIIVSSVVSIIYGVNRDAKTPEERQRALAVWFGGWPPSKGNILLMVVFFSGLVFLPWMLVVEK